MISSRLLFIVTAIFVLQVPSHGSADSELDTHFLRVHNFLWKNIELLDKLATNISVRTESMARDEQQRIDQISDNVTSRINELVDKLQIEVQGVGANVGQCFNQVPQRAVAIAGNLTQGAVQCVVDQVEKARAIVTSLVGLVRTANITLLEAGKAWRDCKALSSPLLVVLCEGGVTTRFSVSATQIALQASKLVGDGVTLINTARQNVETCVSAKLATVPAQIMDLVKNLLDCVFSSIKTISARSQ